MQRNWKEYNAKLVRRAELNIDEDILKNAEKEFRKMNIRKEGHSFVYSDSLMKLLAIIKVKYCIGYRQTIGLVRSFIKIFLSRIPIPDYSVLFR